MRARTRWNIRTLIAFFLSASGLDGGIPNQDLGTLLEAHPGMMAMYDDVDRLIAVYGVPFATDADGATSTEAFTKATLDAHWTAFGLAGLTRIDPPDSIIIRNGTLTVFNFGLAMGGVPIHGVGLKVVVLLGATEKIGYVGFRPVSLPVTAGFPADTVSESQALLVVSQHPVYGHLPLTAPIKVVYETPTGAMYRAWRFTGYDNNEAFRFFVDCAGGQLVGVDDLILHSNVTGQVSGWATPGIAAPRDLVLSELRALPGIEVHELDGQSSPPGCIGGTAVATEFTNNLGEYDFCCADTNHQIDARLVGQWVTVYNGVNPGLRECAVIPDEPASQVDFTMGSPTIEFDVAQVNAFLITELTHDFLKARQPNFTGIDVSIRCLVNYGPIGCGGRFVAGADELWLGRGYEGSCSNGAFSTIITHEYGHFAIHKALGDGVDSRFHEGFSSALAGLVWDTPLIGLGLFQPNVATENLESSDVFFDDCESVPNGCTCPSTGGHCEGLALSGAFWDTRLKLGERFGSQVGLEKARQLAVDFLFVSDGQWDRSILVEVLMADDDDMDLTNGTPHSLDILDAFENLHGWGEPMMPEPGGGVRIEWEGPPMNPVLNTDYIVQTNVFPPNVTLLTTEKSEIPVDRFRVGRSVHANGRQRSLGAITAEWSPPHIHNIPVEIGTISGFEVKSVSSMEIPRQSPANWSSLVFIVEGFVGIASCFANNGLAGGRVSGSAAETGLSLTAEAIGAGATAASVLTIGSASPIELGTIPSGSELLVDHLWSSLVVARELLGNLHIGDTSPPFAPENIPPGFISINGANESSGNVTIDGGSAGLGMTGGSLLLNGPYSGILTIAAMGSSLFNGSLPLIRVAQLDGSIRIAGNQLGEIDVTGTGTSTGEILVDGNITGMITISGDMSGNIHADADENGSGEFSPQANVLVAGTFSGDVCSAALRSAFPGPPADMLPANVQIPNFDCTGTICGVHPLFLQPEPPVVRVVAVGGRYIRVTPGDMSCTIAIRVESIPDSGEPQCVSGYVQANGTIAAAADFQTGAAWGEVLVQDTAIEPDTEYRFDAEYLDEHLEHLGTVRTPQWGDLDADDDLDVDDLLLMLEAFMDFSGLPGTYEGCDLAPCVLDPAQPDVIDVEDILDFLTAFVGTLPYNQNCPNACGGTGQAQGGGGHGPGVQCVLANLSFVPGSAGVEAGAMASLDVNVTCTTPIRGWELHTTITGGSAGSLTLENIVVNESLSNYLFQGATSVKAEHISGARAAAAQYEGGSTAWPTKYLATLTLRASSNARGTFTVSLTAAPNTKIRGADGQTILWQSTPATVAID